MLIVGGLFAQQLKIETPFFQKDIKKSVVSTKSGAKSAGIDNVGFETWHSTYDAYGLGEMPVGYTMITGNPGGQKSTDAHEGSYAMRVESNNVTNAVLQLNDTLVGGFATASQQIIGGGPIFQPYTQRPTTMSFWAKGELFGNDTALVVFQMTKEGEYVGGALGLFAGTDLTSTYQEFSLVMEYESTNMPDSAALIFSSTGVGVFNNVTIGTLTAGSYIIIDDISYEYEEITEPIASCTPLAWNAGGVTVGNNATSGTFTLKNVGAGTLTVSNATTLAAPWSTTFGAISLAENETYEFTFNFAPTAEGPANQSFVITTNGGEITISLSGTGNTAITGTMDGGFETNVNDFDLVFQGWVQHDIDQSASYAIQNTTFTNQNYVGSFIAFNPSATNPPRDESWAPYEGNRYGACFAAILPAQGGSGPNNDWLITPKSDVLTENAIFSAQVQSLTDEYGLDRYVIHVSTTGTGISDFTKISVGAYVQAPTGGWTQINYPLAAYAGQQVYIGIQCVSNDSFVFMIDDINIDVGTAVNSDIAKAVSVYPNPANDFVTVANAENANIVIVNMLGEVVANVNNASSNQNIDISKLANGTYFVKVDGEVFKINVVK